MNAAIKTRLDAIGEQMAALQKEQAKLREELDAPDFVPGWYIVWDGDEMDDKGGGAGLFHCAEVSEKDDLDAAWDNVVPFTPELAARFFPKTRYDWPKIVKEYPGAKWAATDASGRVDLYEERPRIDEGSKRWWNGGEIIPCRACWDERDASDWRDSLEARPEWI